MGTTQVLLGNFSKVALRACNNSICENALFYCRNGKHVLVAYIMKPKAGYDYLATAAHFAAESSTGTNVNVCTTDDFTKSCGCLGVLH